MGKGLINLLANRVAARIPHQSEIGSEEPISASFPPGEAKGAARRRMEARKSIGTGGARPSPTGVTPPGASRHPPQKEGGKGCEGERWREQAPALQWCGGGWWMRTVREAGPYGVGGSGRVAERSESSNPMIASGNHTSSNNDRPYGCGGSREVRGWKEMVGGVMT